MSPAGWPSINVNDLMARIREEVQLRRELMEPAAHRNGNGHSPLPLGGPSELPALPTFHVSKTEEVSGRFHDLTTEALRKTEVDRRIPKIFRRLFRKQGGFNKILLEIAKLFLKSDSRLYQTNSEIVAYLTTQSHWLQAWVQASNSRMSQYETLLQRLDDNCTDLKEITKDLETDLHLIEDDLLGYSEQLHAFRAQLQRLQGKTVVESNRIDLLGASHKTMDEYLSDLRTRFSAFQTCQDRMDTELEALQAGRDKIGIDLERLRDASATQIEVTALRENIGGLKEWLTSQETKGKTTTQEFALLKEQLISREAEISAAAREITALRENLGGLSGWLDDRESLAYSNSRELVTLRENLGGLKEWLVTVASSAEQARNEAQALGVQTNDHTVLGASLNTQISDLKNSVEAMQNYTEALERRQATDGAFLKAQVSFQSGALETLAAASRERHGIKMEATTSDAFREIEDHAYDAFYLAFENKFRGTRSDIKQRVRVYLPSIRVAGAGQLQAPVLDLGCGRGEWLELLREEKLVGRGVDLNEFMVVECTERGLAVEQGNVLEFLGSVPTDSQGAVTAFHLIEHLPFPTLLKLFAESLRVLRPGGVCIFETPNPDNVQVGSNRFYSDPTHLRPLPKEYTKFVMSNAGFSRVAILPLHPAANPLPLAKGGSPVENFVNQMFFGEQDYAVIGHK